MAVALPLKYLGLLAVVLLLYTCCCAFRLRDSASQTCSTNAKCTDKAVNKWAEVALTRERNVPIATSKRPPVVEVTSPLVRGGEEEDDDEKSEEKWKKKKIGTIDDALNLTRDRSSIGSKVKNMHKIKVKEREEMKGKGEEEEEEEEEVDNEEETKESMKEVEMDELEAEGEEIEDIQAEEDSVEKDQSIERTTDFEKVEKGDGIDGSEGDDDEKKKDIVKMPEKKEERVTHTRKLEKVRLADKDTVKRAEDSTSKSTNESMKMETKKSVKSTSKRSNSVSKDKEQVKSVKSQLESSKAKNTTKVKQEKAKVMMESPKLPATTPPPAKVRAKQPEKAKSQVEVKTIGTNRTAKEVTRMKKAETDRGSTNRTQGFATLAELNDALLQVPSFVINFTAVENANCQQHGKIFLRQLRGYKLWALQMFDSNAKFPSGLLRGNINQYGDFDQCLGVAARVKVDEKTVKIQGKYCLALMDMHVSHPLMKLPFNAMLHHSLIRGYAHDPGHILPRFSTMQWGLCLPAACFAMDAENALKQSLSHYESSLGFKFTVKVYPDMCYVKEKAQSYSKETIGVLYFYAMIVCLTLVATIRDYLVTQEGKGSYSERIIMAFSLRRTVKTLLQEAKDDIQCIYGIRSISMLLIYSVHQVLELGHSSFQNRANLLEILNHPISMLGRIFTIYTESFLLISGILSAFNMTKELKKHGQIYWFSRLVGRYIRLTPLLLAVIFWYAFVMEHTGSGPQWYTVVTRNAELCKKNAWTNLLYIQNMFPTAEMCATHTHQLSTDMQLTLIAPIVVYILYYKPIIGVVLIFFLVQVSATIRYVVTINHHTTMISYNGNTIKNAFKSADLMYVIPLQRVTAYVVGASLGVLLRFTGKDVKIHKVFVILGWLISTATMSWVLFSQIQVARKDYVFNVEEITYYNVVSPIAWSLALCWIIFACFTGYGGMLNRFLSNYWFVLLSRISYAVYLSQFIVFFYGVGTKRYPTEFHIHEAVNLYYAVSILIISIVLTLIFDLPMQELKNVVTAIMSVSNQKQAESFEEKADQRTKSTKELENENKETDSTEWVWQKNGLKDSVKKSQKQDVDLSNSKRLGIRQTSLTRHDTIDVGNVPAWNRSKTSESAFKYDEDYMEGYTNDFEEEETEEDPRRGRRSISRSFDDQMSIDGNENFSKHYVRSRSRDRYLEKESDDRRSWEFIGKERSTSIDPEPKRFSSKAEEYDLVSRSMESEERPTVRRRPSSERRHPTVEPKVSDEDDWEQDLRIRRRQFMKKLASEKSASVGDEDDSNSLRRRSSAEGRIALLKDPSGTENMDVWTISVGPRISQLGSSQEPSEPEEDEAHLRRREYREKAPPFRESPQSQEEENNDDWGVLKRHSLTSESKSSSLEDEEEVTDYNFVLTKDSKRISVQDLSKLSQEESDSLESGWRNESAGEASQKTTSLGLFKRESIVKSQASEEDPEYFVPERPKLVQQEEEHPFKKAWQMQKSRSEEDGSSAYTIKDVVQRKKGEDSKRDDEPVQKKSEDVESLFDEETDLTKSTDTEEDSASRRSETDENLSSSLEQSRSKGIGNGGARSILDTEEEREKDISGFVWPTEEKQFEAYRAESRRKSKDARWNWEGEET